MTNRILWVLSILTFSLCSLPAKAQRVALKTNTLDWVLMSPNLTLDTRLSRRVTFEIGIAGNPFSKTPYGSDIMLKNIRIEPSLRYWFNRPMARHFMGVAFSGGVFNVRMRQHCYKGNEFAAGLTYGYALVLNRHWNVEFTLGLGLARVWGYDYLYNEGQPLTRNMSHWLPAPVGTGISFSYILN
ncbi:MAG: DUF3575 domain-containing protein [Duncaniella sp.]